MAKGFTPIIGLAVVVALAMAAVFGAMSLTSPAYAAVNSPADAELTERGLQPLMMIGDGIPAMSLTVADGDEEVTLSDYFKVGPQSDADDGYNADSFAFAAPTYADDSSDEDVATVTESGGTLTISPVRMGVTTVTVTGTQDQTAPVINTGTTEEQATKATACTDAGGTVDGADCEHEVIQMFTVYVVGDDVPFGGADFGQESQKPGSNTRYDISFISTEEVSTLREELIIELADFTFPDSVSPSSVAISVNEPAEDGNDRDFIPGDVTVSGEKLTITLGDMDPGDGTDYDIAAGSTVEVIIRQSAKVKNPAEAGKYGPVIELGDAVDLDWEAGDEEMYPGLVMTVPYIVELDEDDGGRGAGLVATGKGFKNGTALTFWLDIDPHNGEKDPGEEPLCTDDSVSSNIGTCEFTVSNPPFLPGDGDGDGVNFINAIDGDGKKADVGDDHQFKLKPSISVTPDGGSPGETLLLQLQDFGTNIGVDSVTLANSPICDNVSGGLPNCSTEVMIPNDAELGSQRLKVTGTNGLSATKNINIGGPTVTVTPTSLVPNQRVSLTGSGFSANSWISTITIGSQEFEDFGREDNVNSNAGDVSVDNGGRWSKSLVVPMASATYNPGERTIRVTDGEGRTGTATISIPARILTISPPSGRVGTLTTVRGENFPSRNDDGEPVTIEISYDPGAGSPVKVSATPNASGSFEAELRIPTSAIPGETNTVTAIFDDVTTTVTHDVPAGSLGLSVTSGPPGTQVTVTAAGFRTYVPISEVSVGGIEVTPSPKPATDAVGNVEFEILIPGLGNGIQTIEVTVGGGNTESTASVGFTVTASGVASGNTTPVAAGVTALGENFVRSFHFNNDTKMWTFYDPDAGDASTQENFIAGETYWILVMETVDDVILNNTTRNLTCVDGNCWNQIVW